jgi:hypothetical protein
LFASSRPTLLSTDVQDATFLSDSRFVEFVATGAGAPQATQQAMARVFAPASSASTVADSRRLGGCAAAVAALQLR